MVEGRLDMLPVVPGTPGRKFRKRDMTIGYYRNRFAYRDRLCDEMKLATKERRGEMNQ